MNDKDYEKIKNRRVNKFKKILKEICPEIILLNVGTYDKSWFLCVDLKVCVRALVNNIELCLCYDLAMAFDEDYFNQTLKKNKKYVKEKMRNFILKKRNGKQFRHIGRFISKDKSCYRYLANHYTYKENKSESKISKIKRKM